jgi:hypothetical protein
MAEMNTLRRGTVIDIDHRLRLLDERGTLEAETLAEIDHALTRVFGL